MFLCNIVFFLIIVKSLQLYGHRQITELRKYCLVRVIVFFGVCFLYLFCFSQVGILVKFPTSVTSKRVCIKIINDIQTCLLNHSRKTIIYRWICIALCSIIGMYELFFFIKEMEEFALKKLMISRRVCLIIQGKKIIYQRICIALCSVIGTYEPFLSRKWKV